MRFVQRLVWRFLELDRLPLELRDGPAAKASALRAMAEVLREEMTHTYVQMS